MLEYVKSGRYDNIQSWQSRLSHSTEGAKRNRREFWHDVVKASLELLYADEGKLQTSWLGHEGEDATLSNSDILEKLEDILKPSILNFFTNETINAFLAQCKQRMWWTGGLNRADLPFLFVIDEAAYLFHMNYMHSFMWVLDQPVMKILAETMPKIKSTSQFFVLMLGTHSQISHFAPHYYFPSERYFGGRTTYSLCVSQPSLGKRIAASEEDNIIRKWRTYHDPHPMGKANLVLVLCRISS